MKEKINYKWVITKYYKESSYVITKDGFETYNDCVEDMLKHRNIDCAFRKGLECEITSIKMEVLKEEIKHNVVIQRCQNE